MLHDEIKERKQNPKMESRVWQKIIPHFMHCNSALPGVFENPIKGELPR